MYRLVRWGVVIAVLASVGLTADAQKGAKKKKPAPQAPKVEVTYPPKLPGGKEIVTDSSPKMLEPPETLREDVEIAKTPPTIDFLYYPGQDYPGNPWSNWGDSIVANGKYYASIGDHWSVDSKNPAAKPGNGFVYEYDPEKKTVRLVCNLRDVLKLPEGHYSPGKIHGRLDMGHDGCLYFSTHRGSTRVTTDEYHYKGDWIFRCNPTTGKSEVVAQGVVPKHCVPNTVLDPKRLIFYGGTAPGSGPSENIHFFAYDIPNGKVLCDVPNGPARYMIFAKSTGRVYYTPGHADSPLMRFDPAKGGDPVEIPGKIHIRAATEETPQGIVYTVSQGGRDGTGSVIYAFNTKDETVEELGPLAVGSQQYVASIDADPTGRYLYYVPGAHGGSERDNSAVVQFDTKTRKKKVIAFLHPFYQDRYGAAMKGTYSTAVDPKGDKLYITWNINRGSRAWDTCGLTVIHIPESERQ